MLYFITITFKDSSIDPGVLPNLKKYIETKCVAAYVIKETGTYGTNQHFHAFVHLKRSMRTNNITRKVKTWYKNKSYLNARTVRTIQVKDLVYRVGCYMQKESDKDVIFQTNINVDYYIEEYNKRQNIAKQIRKAIDKPKIMELPTVYLAYCDELGLDWKNCRPNFTAMLRDGIVSITHLKNMKWIWMYIKSLKNDELPLEIFEPTYL